MFRRRFWFASPLVPRVEQFQSHWGAFFTPTYFFAHTTDAHDAIQSSSHRALAFAHDVELRLNPWYGRPRTRVAYESYLASPAVENAAVSLTGVARHGGSGDSRSEEPGGGSTAHSDDADREKRQSSREIGVSLSTRKKDDLVACG